MSNSPNSRLAAIFREHPALLVSALYVAASVVGMFYSWVYLRNFGINVFNYAQISDFLLASLKEPFTWGWVALAVVLIMLDNAYSRRVGGRNPARWLRWYGSPRYRLVNNFAAMILVGIFIFTYASGRADDTMNGKGKLVDVSFADDEADQTLTLLGTTGQFIFLYDVDIRRVQVHPLEAIHAISFQAD